MSGCDLIVMGGSWGGMSAVGRVLEDLPADFEPPVVVVLHRGEGSGDALRAILIAARFERAHGGRTVPGLST